MEKFKGTLDKDIKFILFGLTQANLDDSFPEIELIASTSSENCKKVVDILFDASLNSSKYAVEARLCCRLRKSDRLNFHEFEGSRTENENDFWLLVTKNIQRTLEDISQPPKKSDSLYKQKKRKLHGNVSLIGSLYREKAIKSDIIRIATTRLLQSYLEEYNNCHKATEKSSYKTYENIMKNLIDLYDIVGETLEEEQGKRNVDQSKSKLVVDRFQESLKLVNQHKNGSLPKLVDNEVTVQDLFRILNIVLQESSPSSKLSEMIRDAISMKENHRQRILPMTQNSWEGRVQVEEEEIEIMDEDQLGKEVTSGA